MNFTQHAQFIYPGFIHHNYLHFDFSPLPSQPFFTKGKRWSKNKEFEKNVYLKMFKLFISVFLFDYSTNFRKHDAEN